MRYAGAEQLIVVMRSCNEDGAKKLYYPVLYRQTTVLREDLDGQDKVI